MPTMIREYIRSVLAGAVLACCFVAALLVLDVAHLRHLVLTSDLGWLAVLMLVAFNTIVFAGVQFAIRIMGQAEPPSGPGRGKSVALRPAMVAETAKAARSGRRG